METSIYHVDTFTDQIFTGNPATVCILPEWLPQAKLQIIATENGLPATAFIKRELTGYTIRWFTLDNELPLCGHGSLAAAFVIFNHLEPNLTALQLHNPHAGLLNILRSNDEITLEFPRKPFTPRPIPNLLTQGLQTTIKTIYAYNQERCIALLKDEQTVKDLKPDMHILRQLEYPSIVVTAPGTQTDFVSRTFYPRKTVYTEDAVTGSSHCLLIPYWSQQLNKNTLTAQQVSPRGGHLKCTLRDDKVLITSKAVLYARGTIYI